MTEPTLRRVIVNLCSACIAGEGQECHTPGCVLWLHRVDLPIHEELLEVADLPRTPARMSDSERAGIQQIREATQRELDRAEHNGNRGSQLYDGVPAALRVLDRLLDSPTAPPSPLTVAAALALPEVREHGALIRFAGVENEPCVMRIERGALEWNTERDGFNDCSIVGIPAWILDQPCTLVEPEKDHKERQP